MKTTLAGGRCCAMTRQRWTAMLLAGALTLPSLALAQNEEGRRNTAIGLTAGAIYALSKGKDTLGLGLAAGAAYAWKRYLDAKQERERREAAASALRYRTAPRTTTRSRPVYRSTVYRRSAVTQSGVSRPVSTSTQAELARLRAAHAAQQAQQQRLQAQLPPASRCSSSAACRHPSRTGCSRPSTG